MTCQRKISDVLHSFIWRFHTSSDGVSRNVLWRVTQWSVACSAMLNACIHENDLTLTFFWIHFDAHKSFLRWHCSFSKQCFPVLKFKCTSRAFFNYSASVNKTVNVLQRKHIFNSVSRPRVPLHSCRESCLMGELVSSSGMSSRRINPFTARMCTRDIAGNKVRHLQSRYISFTLTRMWKELDQNARCWK